MVDISVALTWIAISAAGVKGLSALARASVIGSTQEEHASSSLDSSSIPSSRLSTITPSQPLGD
jgi:hypothetical protein